MKLLDLFCGAGGAAMGYHRAGFEVVGVDLHPQKNFPFEFIQADAMTFPLDGFDVIHASPPCQLHSTQKTGVTGDYKDLIEETRVIVRNASELHGGIPYVIENVVGAPLLDPVRICGTSMGCIEDEFDLTRHRLFESNIHLTVPPCAHDRTRQTLGIYGDLAEHDRPNRPITEKNKSHRGWKAGKAKARRLMGIDWEVTDRELAESIPPAYTEFIGKQLIEALK